MRYELQSIGVWTVIKVSFFFNLVAGLIIGLIATPFFGTLAAMAMSMGAMIDGMEVDPSDTSLGSMFIIVPLVSALVWGFLGTLLMGILTVIYNLVATILGGLEFDFRDVGMFQDEAESQEELTQSESPAKTEETAGPSHTESPPPPPPLRSAEAPPQKNDTAHLPPPPPRPGLKDTAPIPAAEPEKVGDRPASQP